MYIAKSNDEHKFDHVQGGGDEGAHTNVQEGDLTTESWPLMLQTPGAFDTSK